MPAPERRQLQAPQQTQDSQQVARTAESVNGVERAWVVVSGRTAYVGLELDRQNDADDARSIERNVTQQVENQSPHIDQVLVSSNPDIVKRIQNINEGIVDGRPLAQFQEDLEDIGSRLRPRMER